MLRCTLELRRRCEYLDAWHVILVGHACTTRHTAVRDAVTPVGHHDIDSALLGYGRPLSERCDRWLISVRYLSPCRARSGHPERRCARSSRARASRNSTNCGWLIAAWDTRISHLSGCCVFGISACCSGGQSSCRCAVTYAHDAGHCGDRHDVGRRVCRPAQSNARYPPRDG